MDNEKNTFSTKYSKTSWIGAKDISVLFPEIKHSKSLIYYRKALELEKAEKLYVPSRKVKLLTVLKIMGFKYEDILPQIEKL